MIRPIPRALRPIATMLAWAATVIAVSLPTRAGNPGRPVRQAPKLPQLSAAPTKKRNVLLILTESVRFDSVCVEHQSNCKLSPFTNEIAASRLPLLQVRSNASTTAITAAVLWSGLLPTQTAEAIHSAPLLFDFAHAAGYDTAYWSSQALLFAGSQSFLAALPLSYRCVGQDLGSVPDDAGADDTLLTARAKRELTRLREPWFAVLHYANTHYPYRVRGDEPFQPASESKSPEENAHFQNHYQNAVYAQDRTIADILSSLKASPMGARTVVVYTSDHGEAFREHGQLGHTTSLFEEEIHVPAWVDAPPGTLTESERDSLQGARTALSWHVDFAPTILDLLGLWDLPDFARYRARMAGTSLLRTERTSTVLPIANCTDIWGCGFRNWGVMDQAMKLESRQLDADWHCWDIAADPLEQRDLGPDRCATLKQRALDWFGRLPREEPPVTPARRAPE